MPLGDVAGVPGPTGGDRDKAVAGTAGIRPDGAAPPGHRQIHAIPGGIEDWQDGDDTAAIRPDRA